MLQIAVEKLREIFRCRLDAVHRENLPRDGSIGFPRDLHFRQIIIAPEAVAQREPERLLARAAGVQNRAVDVEKNKPGFVHAQMTFHKTSAQSKRSWIKHCSFGSAK